MRKADGQYPEADRDANRPSRVLAVDDDSVSRALAGRILKQAGFEAILAEDGLKGLQAFREHRPDVVLVDLRMPVMNGLEVLSRLRGIAPDTPVVIVSGTESKQDVVEALRLGAWDYVDKPLGDGARLTLAVERALLEARLLRENRQYRQHLEQSLRRIEEDERAARHIQFQLLPPARSALGPFTFSHYLRTSDLLSGDFFDYFAIDEHHWGLYLADVSGHGVSSAFITVLLKSTMSHLLEEYRQEGLNIILDPARVLRHINQDLMQRDFAKYLTMVYAVINEPEGRITLSNGGHFPWPVLCNGDHKAKFIETKTLPVGLFDQAAFRNEHLMAPGGFTMVLFSDGVLEVLKDEHLRQKTARLVAAVADCGGDVDALVERLGLAKGPAADDIGLLSIARAGRAQL